MSQIDQETRVDQHHSMTSQFFRISNGYIFRSASVIVPFVPSAPKVGKRSAQRVEHRSYNRVSIGHQRCQQLSIVQENITVEELLAAVGSELIDMIVIFAP